MNNRKIVALIVSLAMIIGAGLPGTLALSADVAEPEVAGKPVEEPAVMPTPDVIPTSESPAPAGTTIQCACGTGTDAHAEDCPLYTAPVLAETSEVPAYIENCIEGCTGGNCECPCHAKRLFDRLMACKTLEEMLVLLEAAPKEERMVLTEDESAKVEAKLTELEPEPAPTIVIDESEPPVKSEICAVTVNCADVAQFGEPVVGGQ